jgi:diaminohydroxyphosphoribosylaminopyrimidine deaminase/5-amino-6-(5-phosphoribosylamino)uracil reductase
VLVYNNRIIGEGYHQQYGQPHAEVNCINSVTADDKELISSAILYVSLEPCAHFGKTPPCADLIIAHKINKVVIGSLDPFEKVNGKGVEKLKSEGIEVITGILAKECNDLNKRFFTYHTLQRPYIILKWAQSANHRIAKADKERVLISNEYSNRLVHKWRSEEAGIMVGTNTALTDNPRLNTRLWNGADPVRLVIDLNLRLPSTLNIYDKNQRTIILNRIKGSTEDNLIYIKLKEDGNLIHAILDACYKSNIQSILVEGGTKLLQSFINENVWDEARVIQNNNLIIEDGLPAPVLKNHQLSSVEDVFTDTISYYKNSAHN